MTEQTPPEVQSPFIGSGRRCDFFIEKEAIIRLTLDTDTTND